jgi:hypothetical protein
MTDDLLEGLDRRLNRSSLIVTVIAVPIVLLVHSVKSAFSLAAGAGLSYINFHWLKQAVDYVVLEGAKGRSGRLVFVRFVARYALIALFLYVTIRSSLVDLIFVFAGLLVYVVAILVECVSEVGRVLVRDYRNGRRTTKNSEMGE